MKYNQLFVNDENLTPVLGDNKDSSKKAYPNYDQYMYIPGQYDTQKWLQTARDLFYKEKNGLDRVNAVRQVTTGWNNMETFNFLNWLKYYEEGAHLKYKMANFWYENGSPGYFLHIKKDPEKDDVSVDGKDIDSAKDSSVDNTSASEKRSVIEKQRRKIVARLDSVEKLLRSEEGQVFGGTELEALLDAIYQLKKKVHMINKISTSTRLYDDIIVREANVLGKKGFIKAANLLYSVADNNTLPSSETPASADPLANAGQVSPDGPTKPSGAPGGLPSTGPGAPQVPPAPDQNSPMSLGISQFIENMNGDVDQNDDELEVMDSEDELTVEAQATPLTPNLDKVEKPKVTIKDPLEVDENTTPTSENVTLKDFDHMIDAAFSSLTITDVVSKLEDLAKIFKTREVPRQLAVVDMMLDSLGLASFFPSLSEATNKALESNNYISTRVEDILSKLRGAMKTKDIDLKGGEGATKTSPELEGVKSNLKNQSDKEQARKQMRKDMESKELEGGDKETPNVEIEEDLSKPAQSPKVAPTKTPLPNAPRPLV